MQWKLNVFQQLQTQNTQTQTSRDIVNDCIFAQIVISF
jgi:hypothetical protein